MATAGNVQVSNVDTVIYTASPGCTIFMVKIGATQPHAIMVHIPSLHDEGDYFTILPGQAIQFHSVSNGIEEVVAKSAGSDPVWIDYGILGKY